MSLSVAGVALPNIAVTGLAADSKQLVEFTGPRCNAGTTLVATADPREAVDRAGQHQTAKTSPIGLRGAGEGAVAGPLRCLVDED